MNLYSIPTRSKRKTTSAYELALSVIFLSGIQHYAESPEGMAHVSPFVKDFLRTLPDSWDDVKFIEGFPGKDVVLGRKFGNKWYIAGINGDTTTQKTFDLDLSAFKMKKAQLITDGDQNASFVEERLTLQADTKRKITVKPAGGFVLVLE
jgi:alpha-glucosidase